MSKLLSQLQQDGVLSIDQARVVAIECANESSTELTVILQSEFVTGETLDHYGGNSLSIELNAAEFVPDESALQLLDEKLARQYCALPMSYCCHESRLVIALDDVSNIVVRDSIKRNIDKSITVEFCKASTTGLRQALDKCYGHTYTLSAVLAELDEQVGVFSQGSEAAQAPVVRFIETLLQDAITRRASDIHLSPERYHLQIRYRVDGVLFDACCLHIRYWSAILVRIKVLSDLDIAETRQPQDGHLARIIHGVQIDFRVASFPLNSGENLVLRVLDRRRGLLKLSELCHDIKTQSELQRMVKRPCGMVLVCGPTGSGKTTTLYALLRSMNAESLNIMTLEDPVEYPVAKLRQTRVNGNSALSFGEGVRGVLRQDPDVILVGEVRDTDSCAMSCRAALTGHLVLTSTHANSCIGAISRLLELGVTRTVLASVLSGVVSQRLLRKVCSQCSGQQSDCRVCFGTGYSGRLALFECLTVSESFAAELQSGASLSALKALACEEGLVPMAQQAQACFQAGKTSEQEIARVLGDDAM